MNRLLLTLSLPFVALAAHAADDLPPPRAAIQEAADDLPPPRRTSTRAPAAAEAAPPAAAADELPPPRRTARSRARSAQPTLKFGIDDLLAETGVLPDAAEADTYSTLRVSPYVQWQPSRDWEFRAGARLDGMSQAGGRTGHDELLADYSDTYVRYRSGDTRLTFGAQTIIWGRVDEIPLADRVSRADLTRFALDDLADRRRAQLAARWEQTMGEYKLDAVWLPVFRGAQLPDPDSVWSPVNRTTRQIIGIDPSLTTGWLGAARIEDNEHGSGGGAIRLTRTGEPFDFGVTLARTRQSLPYYRIDVPTLTLTAVHPFNNFVGADMEMVSGGLTWRMEVGYTDNVPYTQPTTVMDTTHALDWIGALEFFPGGGDTRVNLQLVAHALQTDRASLELKEYYGANGEVEIPFANGRWKAAMRFATGFNVRDVYLGPKISYVGWEPHEIYLAGHYFDGENRTLGGFHQDHSLITLGLRTRF
ncbi:MAG: hypothetical protein BGO61_01255 [Thiobacillus sp. 65-69]|nr:hypothetical protein [Thiobacillus sp.]ODU88089.1 MAG: hypothetical protein ABT21_11900 [Thiobacillus sp. SCN 65-179]OJW36337.1 MAG: hypothetical protein BGO61_01255 [Thiobacillus sp. 65-69]